MFDWFSKSEPTQTDNGRISPFVEVPNTSQLEEQLREQSLLISTLQERVDQLSVSVKYEPPALSPEMPVLRPSPESLRPDTRSPSPELSNILFRLSDIEGAIELSNVGKEDTSERLDDVDGRHRIHATLLSDHGQQLKQMRSDLVFVIHRLKNLQTNYEKLSERVEQMHAIMAAVLVEKQSLD